MLKDQVTNPGFEPRVELYDDKKVDVEADANDQPLAFAAAVASFVKVRLPPEIFAPKSRPLRVRLQFALVPIGPAAAVKAVPAELLKSSVKTVVCPNEPNQIRRKKMQSL
jgi:hypothetical protein